MCKVRRGADRRLGKWRTCTWRVVKLVEHSHWDTWQGGDAKHGDVLKVGWGRGGGVRSARWAPSCEARGWRWLSSDVSRCEIGHCEMWG